MPKELGIGIVGTGWVATEHIQTFLKNEHTHVTALCGRTEEGARQKAAECGLGKVAILTDYEEMLRRPDVDVVAICTPNHLHPDQVIKGAQAGKHLIIEKPIAVRPEELAPMRDAIGQAGIIAGVCFELRWNPLVQTMKRLTGQGVLGDIWHLEADYIHRIGPQYPCWKWARFREYTGTSMVTGGCHAVDIVRWLASIEEGRSVEITEVQGYTGGFDNATDYPGLEVIIVKLANGATAKVSANTDAVTPYWFPIRLFGTKGTMRDAQLYAPEYFPGQTDWIPIPTIALDSGDVSHHPFQGLNDHFIQSVLNNTRPYTSFEDALNTHEACFAAELSAKAGRPIPLPLDPALLQQAG